MVVTTPVLAEALLLPLSKLDAVPSAPLAGREDVSRPVYSKTWRASWAAAPLVKVTVWSDAPAEFL
jgi:hypothetical protein